MKFATRINRDGGVHWAVVHKLISEKEAQGVDVIRISSGDPDLPTPMPIVETLREAVLDPTYQRYPFSFQTGLSAAIAQWYQTRFGVTLEPNSEVLPLSGSQQGLGMLGMAVMEEGATALMTNPAYGSYSRATEFAGGSIYEMPISAENNYLPDLEAIPADVLKTSRLLWLNYPNNPTGAIAPLSFFEEVVAFAKQHDLIVCHDNAYSDIVYDGYQSPSFLAAAGAKEVGVEINTLSKTYNMAGWRVGIVVGNADIIQAMRTVYSNTNMGLFGPVQLAAIEAITGDQSWLAERNAVYERRRDIIVNGLRRAGFACESPKATLYVWAKIPEKFADLDSLTFSKMLLDKCGVWLSSGVFFGSGGDGHIRATMTLPDEKLIEAMDRINDALA